MNFSLDFKKWWEKRNTLPPCWHNCRSVDFVLLTDGKFSMGVLFFKIWCLLLVLARLSSEVKVQYDITQSLNSGKISNISITVWNFFIKSQPSQQIRSQKHFERWKFGLAIYTNRLILISISLKIDRPSFMHICGALRDLVPFVQFKKHKKHPWSHVF